MIHDSSGRTLLKDYFIVQHNFNVKMTSKLCSSKESVLKTLEQCNKLKAKYNDIFSENIRTGRTVTGAIQQNKSHKRKALKRRLKRLKIN